MTLLASLLCSGPVGPMTEAMISLWRITALVMVEPISMPAKYSFILKKSKRYCFHSPLALRQAQDRSFDVRPKGVRAHGFVRDTEASESKWFLARLKMLASR